MKIKYKKQLFLSFLFAFLCYGTYIFPHYSQDVYTKAYVADPGVTLKFVFETGRFTYGIINRVLTDVTGTHIPISICFRIFPIIMIALIIYNAFIIIVPKNISVLKEEIYFVSVCLIFLNPLFADWFQFPECIPIYIVGVFGAVYASAVLFLPGVKHPAACSILLLILSVGIYQPVIIYFVLFVLIQAWNCCLDAKEKKMLPELIAKIGAALGSYVSASMVQILIVKFGSGTGETRVNGNISDNISVVLAAQKSLWFMENTGESNWFYLFAFVVICLYIISVFVIHQRDRKEVGLYALIFTIFAVTFYLALFVTHIFIEPWISQRTVTGFLAVISLLVVMIMKLSDGRRADIRALKGIYGLLIALLLLFIYRTNGLSLDLIKTNEADKQLSQMIVNYVEEYEKNSGVDVTKIAYCNDANVTWAYDGIYCGYDLNVRGWAKNWCIPSMIQFYTGRNFKETDMPDHIYDEKFSGKNWNYFNFEQIYIHEDMLCICVF